ncbi:MAG: ankyrin repeat domain-containing protein [Pseudomonadota bacterium]
MKKHNKIALALGIPGILLQLALGLAKDAFPEGWFTYFVIALYIVSFGLQIVGLGYYAKGKGRSPAWGLMGLLSCIGLIVLASMKDLSDGQTTDVGQELIKAARDGQLEKVRSLLRQGADVNAKEKEGYLILLGKEGEVSTKEDEGHILLKMTTLDGYLESVKLLQDQGAEFSTKEEEGHTALMWASSAGNEEVMKLLIEKGADINAKSNTGYTAFMLASSGGQLEVVKLLLDKGADVNAQMTDGRTALMAAAQGGHLEVMKFLIENGAEVNAQTNTGYTAFMLASSGGQLEVVKLLLEKEAEIAAKDKGKRIPSHHYALAHIVIPAFCFRNPYLFFNTMTSPELREHLFDELLWPRVCEISDVGGKPWFGGIKDLHVSPTNIKGFPTVIIVFPNPRRIPEVFMVAVVLKNPAVMDRPDAGVLEIRYFTLELGFGDDNQFRTYICEWERDGSRNNHGTGTKVTYPQMTPHEWEVMFEFFVQGIETLLSEDTLPKGRENEPEG